MRKPFQLSKSILCGTMFLAGTLFWGCSVKSTEYDLIFDEEEVERIQLRKTTKEEILDWFGPPNAMATKGKTFQFGASDAGGKEEPINNEIFFELFSEKHQLANHHSVYLYATSEASGGTFLFFSGSGPDIDKLWILVNQESGLVEDYVYRPHKNVSSDEDLEDEGIY